MGVTDQLLTQHGCSRSRPLQGWISPRRGLHGQGCPDRALQGALRQVLRGLRREVRRGVLGQEEGHGDPQPRDGDQRVTRNLQDPQAEEGEQVEPEMWLSTSLNIISLVSNTRSLM